VKQNQHKNRTCRLQHSATHDAIRRIKLNLYLAHEVVRENVGIPDLDRQSNARSERQKLVAARHSEQDGTQGREASECSDVQNQGLVPLRVQGLRYVPGALFELLAIHLQRLSGTRIKNDTYNDIWVRKTAEVLRRQVAALLDCKHTSLSNADNATHKPTFHSEFLGRLKPPQVGHALGAFRKQAHHDCGYQAREWKAHEGSMLAMTGDDSKPLAPTLTAT
jgi:hypothetical protein